MAIQFTGLGSGMDYSSWIDALVAAKQVSVTNIETKIEKTEASQNALKSLQTSFTSLSSTITTFTDSNLISAFDIFGRRKITASDEGKTASATVSNSATLQNFKLKVNQLATPTIATGVKTLGKVIDNTTTTNISDTTTKLKNLYNVDIPNGTYQISIGAETKALTVNDDTTVQDLLTALTGDNITASLDNGKIKLVNAANTEVNVSTDPNGVLRAIGFDDDIITVPAIDVDDGSLSTTKELKINTSSPFTTALTSLNNGVITKGEISVFINNEEKRFTVYDGTETDHEKTTVQDFIDFLSSKGEYESSGAGLKEVGIQNGVLSFKAPAGQNVKIGSIADSSNLLKFFGFNEVEDGIFTSEKMMTQIDTTASITQNSGGLAEQVTTGKFKIGNATFEITNSTSISGLLYQINSNPDAGALASYDAVSNKLVLTAKEAGGKTINIEPVLEEIKDEGGTVTGYKTTNFTDVVGWTNTQIDSHDVTDWANISPVDKEKFISRLNNDSQELGKNAEFEIDGKVMSATSNTINSDVTGITGLTLTLNKVTSEDAEPAQFSISNDLTEVESAINSFIEKFNKIINEIKEKTASDGELAYDSSLRRMSTEMSNTVMNSVGGLSQYISFATVGISTGSNTKDVSNVSLELTFDKSKFEEAMAKNPEEVKKLFINEDKENPTDNTNNGVMIKLKRIVSGYDYIDKTSGESVHKAGYLDYNDGYFTIKNQSYETQLKTYNDSLTRKKLSIESYRARLEKQFQNMDSYMSKMSSYSNYLSSIGS